MPSLPADPLGRVPVKHERQGRGSEGTLVLYTNGLVYLTDRQDDARYWRFSDLFSVLRIDRERFEVRAYEGGGGKIRPFVFELKTDLPDGFYDVLWQRVNGPASAGPRGDEPGARVLPADSPAGIVNSPRPPSLPGGAPAPKTGSSSGFRAPPCWHGSCSRSP